MSIVLQEWDAKRRSLNGLLGCEPMRALLVVLVLLATPSASDAEDCNSRHLLRIPLTSSTATYHARVGSGYVLVVVQDAPGWEVQVFRATDRSKRDNLLYPKGNWHGAFPNQIQPGVSEEIFPNIRRVPVRATPHSVCIRLMDVSKSVTNGSAAFRGGSLEVGWSEGNRKRD
jgi:hypothetical protein